MVNTWLVDRETIGSALLAKLVRSAWTCLSGHKSPTSQPFKKCQLWSFPSARLSAAVKIATFCGNHLHRLDEVTQHIWWQWHIWPKIVLSPVCWSKKPLCWQEEHSCVSEVTLSVCLWWWYGDPLSLVYLTSLTEPLEDTHAGQLQLTEFGPSLERCLSLSELGHNSHFSVNTCSLGEHCCASWEACRTSL